VVAHVEIPHGDDAGGKRAKASAEAGEIEVDGDGVAFGGNDFDGDRVGGECANGKLQIDGSASRTARAIAATSVERAASYVGGRKNLVSVRHLDVKVPPEIIVARDERGRRGGSRALRIGDHGAVGIGQIDFDSNLDELLLAAMIKQGLLRTVVPDVIAGDLGKLREGSEKSNRGDVRAGLGPREKFDVIAQEGRVVALSEEISFADGFVGKRSV